MANLVRLPGPQPEKWEWQLRAACRGMDSSIFFHPFNEQLPARQRRIDAAKAICGSCPAVDECRTHALTVQEPYGIWGGLSERDRASLLGVSSMRYPARRPGQLPYRPDPSSSSAQRWSASAVNA
jgi:WhiB family redox-sensing transcriptional regulator